MARLLRTLVVCFLLLALPGLAQSADQEALSATDSPDPVIPGNNITYTIQIRNNGPDPAVNGGLNANLDGALSFVSASGPAGFFCSNFGNAVSCTNPSFPAGSTATFTVVALAPAHLLNFPDGSFNSLFFPSGTTPDPNNGNNNTSATTAFNSPQIDLSLTVTDSPDPVFSDGNITYTIPVTNSGPDAATAVNFNVFNNGSLQFQSATIPGGWNCTLPSVGGNPTFTCTTPTFVPSTVNFTVVLKAEQDILGINDGTVSAVFGVNGTGDDTNHPNNTEQEDTAYVIPDADMTVSVTDSPDPVFPDGNITYTVNVGNTGPDTAPNAVLNFFNNGSLQFQSISAPAGWSCTAPAVNATPTFGCTNPSFASGSSVVFTLVVQADATINGINDGTLLTNFTVGSAVSDPDNSGNSENETTAYVTPDADMTVSVTDSPDPVFPDGNITYTVNVGNTGPDTAPNAVLNFFNNGSLQFQSISTPAGWNCTAPAVNATPTFGCTNPSFASGSNVVFTLVVQADATINGINDGTLLTNFSVGSSVSDPDTTDNSENETTAYVTPDADMTVSVTDSPDPVFPDGNITYTINVGNPGPDAAPNAALNFFNNGSLQFQSISAPAGWSCTPPAVNATPTFGCTNPSFASGSNVVFTLVVQADATINGINDGTLLTNFSVGSGVSDPDNTDNSENETTAYVTPDADISVTNADSPDPVVTGGTITYTQSITNNGPDAAPNATFAQTLPASVGFQSLIAPAGWSCTTPAVGASGTINCSLASMPNGSTANFTVVVTVLAPSGTVGNTVTGGSSAQDPDPLDNSVTVNTTILAAVIADLAITKSTASDGAAAGSTLVYTITLTNNGPDPAANVVVTDVLPAELLFRSISIPSGFNCTTPASGANGTISCTAASMASGTTATFTLVVQLTPTAVGPINNNATATSDTTDNDAGNSNGSAGGVPVSAGNTADLSVQKSSPTTTAAAGDPVTYTIVVTNQGPGTANDIVVIDDLPASLLFQSITPAATFNCVTPAVGQTGTIICSGGTLTNGGTATFTLVTTIAPSASGSFTNGVSVSTTDSDPAGGNSADDSEPVLIATADLSINKSTLAPAAPTGSTILYTITVTNNGPDAATGVTVTDDLLAGLQFVSATPSQGTCNASDPVTCNLGTINNGASATISLQVMVTATSGTITNTASVTAVTDDGNPGNNGSTTPPILVGAPATPEAGVPTMSEWALIAMAALLGLAALTRMRI